MVIYNQKGEIGIKYHLHPIQTCIKLILIAVGRCDNTNLPLPGKTLSKRKDTIMATTIIPNLIPVKKLDHTLFEFCLD